MHPEQRRLSPAALLRMFTRSASSQAFRSPNRGLAVCFDETFCYWHAICESVCDGPAGPFLPVEGALMLKIELYNHGTTGDPAVSFPTDAEIAIADQLRHQLEERYLAPSAPSSPSQVRSSEGR